MTVADLILALQGMPQDVSVVVWVDSPTKHVIRGEYYNEVSEVSADLTAWPTEGVVVIS